ncbi:MAG: hypothetical protein RL095_2258 [Verrucomicrobiota bacterium]|jgi:hypothetical protein
MHAIEFEATAHQHVIRVPDGVPDGVPFRVLLLSASPLSLPSTGGLKSLLSGIAEGLNEEDLHRPRDLGRLERE